MNIRINDFRIGNLVIGEYEKSSKMKGEEICKISGITEKYIFVDSINPVTNSHPIYLSKEWMIIFGGVKIPNERNSWMIFGEKFQKRSGRGVPFYEWNNINIKYVHQLQNLIYAIKQVELLYEFEIEEPSNLNFM